MLTKEGMQAASSGLADLVTVKMLRSSSVQGIGKVSAGTHQQVTTQQARLLIAQGQAAPVVEGTTQNRKKKAR